MTVVLCTVFVDVVYLDFILQHLGRRDHIAYIALFFKPDDIEVIALNGYCFNNLLHEFYCIIRTLLLNIRKLEIIAVFDF